MIVANQMPLVKYNLWFNDPIKIHAFPHAILFYNTTCYDLKTEGKRRKKEEARQQCRQKRPSTPLHSRHPSRPSRWPTCLNGITMLKSEPRRLHYILGIVLVERQCCKKSSTPFFLDLGHILASSDELSSSSSPAGFLRCSLSSLVWL